LYVPKVTVPILIFNVPKLDVPKKHVPKAYVPKLSCTECDLPRCDNTARVKNAPILAGYNFGKHLPTLIVFGSQYAPILSNSTAVAEMGERYNDRPKDGRGRC